MPKVTIEPVRFALPDSADYGDHVYHTNGAYIGDFRGGTDGKVKLLLLGREHWVDRNVCMVGEPQPVQPVSFLQRLRSVLLGF